MTIPASMPSRVVYQGDGVTVNFPIPFVYFGNGDGTKQLKAVLADATGENEQVLTENIDFTITAAGQVNGTMTMKTAPTAKQKLTVIYDIPIEQLVDWKEFGRLPSESIEAALDKVTAILKQQNEVLNRCVKVIVSGNQSPQELLDEVYEKLDSATAIAGTAITAADNAREAADKATAAVASAEQTLVEVTFYVDTAKEDIALTVEQAKADIADTIIAAVADVKQQAIDAANEAIDGASVTVTQTAKDNLNAYVDGTIEPSLQHFVDAAKDSEIAAAVSAREAEKTFADLSTTATIALDEFNTNANEKQASVDASAKSAAQSAAAALVSQGEAETAKVSSIENADRAEYWANNTEVQSQSVYQGRIVLESPVIVLQERKCRYIRDVLAGDAFTIDKSAIKQLDKDLTFELILRMPAVVSFNLGGITSKWMGGDAPDLSETGEHWFAFTSQDGGQTWRGSYEGRFAL